jgi:hypothetical protein
MSEEQNLSKPFKIIYRYRNNNRKFQYHYYVFLGNVPNNIRRIVSKITDLSFFQTLKELSPDEITSLENYYDTYWYENFFLSDHLKKSRKIFNSSSEKDKITRKLGITWVDKHIKQIKKTNLVYSYNGKIKIERLKKQYMEDKEQLGGNVVKPMVGGDDDDNSDDTDTDNTDEDEENQEDTTESEIFGEQLAEERAELKEPEDDFNVNELEDMHVINEDIDKDAEKNKKLITEILEEEANRAKTLRERNIIFDEKNSNNHYNGELDEVIEKHFIYSQYIYQDDTFLNMKKKICMTIEKSKQFESSVPFLIPSRIYLWSEYTFNEFTNNKYEEKKDYLMLGRNWLRQNTLLPVDVVPLENFRDYEILKGQLGVIKESMNRYGSRIHFEDNNQKIINDYIDYIPNNEIFMTDIYTELGKNYKSSAETIKNLTDFYVKIYFTESVSELSTILEYLNGNTDVETKKIRQIITTIDNDLSLENQVMSYIEDEFDNKKAYENYYKDNFITQTTTHVSLYLTNLNGREINLEKETTISSLLKFDLSRIFENYALDEKYPYIQYQPPDAAGWHKFRTISPEYDKEAIQSKWLESNPYGISFKIKVDIKGGSTNKYISVKLTEYGKLEYKTQWKEDDQATFEDINKTFVYVQELIKKINGENSYFKIFVPQESDFKFAFINNIQSFQLPVLGSKDKSYIINHNELSDFCRLFFPYLSVVIEPRKRESKTKKDIADEKSKYGTYLRYKRVSDYYSEMNIERRIRYFLKNYEYDEKGMAKEIASQYNLTDVVALQKVREGNEKFAYLKKGRNILKKFENVPRAKPSGVEVDIQGKSKENYKIRISGARSQWQLNEILRLMNIVLYLYVDIYHVKNKDRRNMMDVLKSLNNIAKRRNMVELISDVVEEVRTVKKITKLDKDRLGFKPEKGQNHWSRNCQNSGTKKRQPTQYVNENELIKHGYTLNKETNNYEKKVKINGKEQTLRSIKIPTENANLFYTCDIEVNKKYSYIGYLTKSKHPSGLCMPCCFKNDSFNTKNSNKREFNEKCANKGLVETVGEIRNIKSDKIYILQETNKVQEGRFSFLPEYLDVFFNKLVSNDKIIKNHYLTQSKSGYFFKYGVSNQKIPYLSAIASLMEKNYEDIVEELFKNMDDILFTCLNNGEIKLRFGEIDTFKNYIVNGIGVTHEFLDDLVSYRYDINSYIFEKRVAKRMNENGEWLKYDDYVLICKNNENYNNYKTRKNIIVVKDETLYFPVLNLQKDAIASKKEKYINIKKVFEYEENENNIVNRINKYYSLNCLQNTKLATNVFYNSKEIQEMLIDKFSIVGQVIDYKYKCRFLMIKGLNKNTFLFPVQPSGCLKGVQIYKNYNEYSNSINASMKFIMDLDINIVPAGVTYSQKLRDKYLVSGIYIQENIILPITTVRMDENEIKRLAKDFKIKNFMIVSVINDDIIDREIMKGPENIIVDDRIIKVNRVDYTEESYDRLRLEISEYLHNNIKLKDELEDLTKKSVPKTIDFLHKLVRNIITIIPRIPKLEKYTITNFRQLCRLDKTCTHYHCGRVGKTCQLQLTREMLDQFIVRLSNEINFNPIKRQEILRKNTYSVPDIYQYDFFTSKKNEKLIKTSNLTIDSILGEIYGENNIPIIGKKRLIKKNLEIEIFPPKIFGSKIEQLVKKENGLYRTIINGYYWIKNKLMDAEYRNLGYESSLQNDIINLFKGKIIKWIFDENNLQRLYKYFDIKSIPQMKEKLVSNEPLDTMYKYEIYILSDLLDCKINVYNQYDEKVIEIGKSENVIDIKYEIYNDVITKFYIVYNSS